ncbi:MAG: hypothetical protein O7A08_04535, partial [SAR324 cluster bacterium]|nr:hypothetical protein [SAR324 cluster bacterium]
KIKGLSSKIKGRACQLVAMAGGMPSPSSRKILCVIACEMLPSRVPPDAWRRQSTGAVVASGGMRLSHKLLMLRNSTEGWTIPRAFRTAQECGVDRIWTKASLPEWREFFANFYFSIGGINGRVR